MMMWGKIAFAAVLIGLVTIVADAASEPARDVALTETQPARPATPQRREPPPRREPGAPQVKGEPPRRTVPVAGRGGRHGCLSTAETRDVMAAKRLVAPFMALRSAGSHARGETIGVRLCRHANDDLMYEINVLRRDGRVVKVIVDASSGKITRLINDR